MQKSNSVNEIPSLNKKNEPHRIPNEINEFYFLALFISKGLWRYGTPIRLHLGCGSNHLDGYINIDYSPSRHNVINLNADVFADIMCLDFPDQFVDEIRLHHVFEHFSRVNALALLINWHKWLKIGGKLHIETPDLFGSIATLLSTDVSWKTKIGVIRHLTGDQAASWGYHNDLWYPARFKHTLSKLGFECIETTSHAWAHEPFLSNVTVLATKTMHCPIKKQVDIADQLLWESTVSQSETKTYHVWKDQLRSALNHNNFSLSDNSARTTNT